MGHSMWTEDIRTGPAPAWRPRSRPSRGPARHGGPWGGPWGGPMGGPAAVGGPDVRPRVRRWRRRPRWTAPEGATGRRALRDPRRARHLDRAGQRLPGDPADRRPHRRRVEAEPRLGLPDHRAAPGRGTRRGRSHRAARRSSSPTTAATYVADHAEEMAAVWAPFAEEADDDEALNFKQVIGQTVGAIVQVVTTGTPDQRAKARRDPRRHPAPALRPAGRGARRGLRRRGGDGFATAPSRTPRSGDGRAAPRRRRSRGRPWLPG